VLTEQRGRRCARAELDQRDPSDARLYEMEAQFLDARLRALQRRLHDLARSADLSGQTSNEEAAAWRAMVADARRREAEILLELRAAPEREQRHLECLLGDRLRIADRLTSCRSSLATQRGQCDGACWNANLERQTLAKILRDWWRWLRTRPAEGVDGETTSWTDR
jgi:hypothetical protein